MDDWLGVREIGLEAGRISAGCEGNGSVGGVCAVVSPDGILVHEVCGGGNDGAALFGVCCSPHTGYRVYIELAGVTAMRARRVNLAGN